MKAIRKLMKRHIIYCPKCSTELFFDATSGRCDYLKCLNKNCNGYFILEKHDKKLYENGSYLTVIESLQKRGLIDWPGIATSIAYKPKWVKLIEIILRESKKS